MAPESKKINFEGLDEEEIEPMEIAKEPDKFIGEGDLYKVLYRLERQKIYLRGLACSVAIATVFVLGFLEYEILQRIEFLSTTPGDLIFLVVSPIFAVTAIVVSFLISVFRVNVDNVGKATQIIGGTSSGLG